MNYPKRSQISKINMQVRCEELNKIFYKDHLSPFLVLKASKDSKGIEEVWKSKTLQKTFNPVFQELVEVNYSFSENTRYIFEIYHESTPESPFAILKTTVKELLSAPKGMLIRELDTGFKKAGKIVIHSQLIKSYNSFFSLKLEARELPSSFWKNLFGMEKMLLKIEKKFQNQLKDLFVSQSQPYNEHLQWDSVQVQFNGDIDQIDSRIRFSLCKDTPHPVTSFGICQFQWNKLGKNFECPFLNPQGEKQGLLVIKQCKYKTEHNFFEFIEAGLNFNLTIGIDFSASIIPASNHRSPHYTGKGDSFYMNVMKEVAQFLYDFTSENKSAVYSVGAIPKFPKIYSGNKVDQCFPINENKKDPRIQGIEALREHYNYAVKHLQFSGPTDFRQVIKQAMITSFDRKKIKEEYSVLVLLTDGKINNLKQIETLLGQCSTLPLYIVFLGVDGTSKQLEDLANMKMEVYTADKDLVQRENIVNYGYCSKEKGNVRKVITQVFANLPDVVSKYMNLRKKTPQKLREFLSEKQLRKLTQSPTKSDNVNPQV